MDYLEQRPLEGYTTLDELLKNSAYRRSLLENRAYLAEKLYGIFSATEHLHNHGISHEDIGDNNVLITPYRWMLWDYSVAGLIGTPRMDMACGNFNYYPPEQFTGTKSISPTTDTYLLATLVRKIIVKSLNPLRESTVYNYYADAADMPLLEAYSPGLPEIIAKGQAYHMENRFQTIPDLWNDLRNVF